MDFVYYYVMQGKEVTLNTKFLKFEVREGIFKWIPFLKGYQKATLFQSIHEAEFAIKQMGLKVAQTKIIPITISLTGEEFKNEK